MSYCPDWNAKFIEDKFMNCTTNSTGKRFFFKFWRSLVLFMGLLIPLFLDFWWHRPWVSKPGWIFFHLCALSPAYNRFLRLTSGVTPPDLLSVSIVANPFQSIYLHTSIGGTIVLDEACQCFTAHNKAGAVPTELGNLGLTGKQKIFFLLFSEGTNWLHYFSMCFWRYLFGRLQYFLLYSTTFTTLGAAHQTKCKGTL